MVDITREQAEKIVSQQGWLSHMPQPFRDKLFQHAMLIRMPPNHTVFRHGDPVGGIYGLVAGCVTVNLAPANATPCLVHLGLPGAWTGEGCFLTGQPRRVELKTLTETHAFHLPLDIMQKLSHEDYNIVRAFGAISIFSTDVLIHIIHDLQKRNPAKRIASVLRRIVPDENTSVILSQAEIATMTNTSRQQVNVALKKFADAGWIEYSYRSISFLNLPQLAKFSTDGADD
ncbi:Crp/Fnr family transcriptional regulator [Brucella sp. BE17]|uniref:Crp/Fnr family transcriptional regulator n=1 Tax=Brucella sp. BE17 TaxID=3142977 RepID=UPI0031BB7363